MFEISTELKTFELNILNSDRLINLEESKHYSISRLRKRVDQALIPISTIQKFPAQVENILVFEKLAASIQVRFSRKK